MKSKIEMRISKREVEETGYRKGRLREMGKRKSGTNGISMTVRKTTLWRHATQKTD